MRIAIILILVAAVISAVILVQTGVDFRSNAAPRFTKPVPLPKTCTKNSDCEINKLCPPNAKCVRFFDKEMKFACQNGKCVVSQAQ